jgi:predicted nucleotidyltransferase
MLDITAVDLGGIAEALEDHSDFHSWYFDPETGETEPWASEFYRDEDEERDPDERGLLAIYPEPSDVGYQDMADFVDRVGDPRARDLLDRAIAGRGAFRRFKDTLFEFPDLRAEWFAFRNNRWRCRAVEWLLAHHLVEESTAHRYLEEHPDPETAKPFDADEGVRAVAADLRDLYGDRLRDVVLHGAWTRGDADDESAVDLLVVLDRVDSAFLEQRRMDEILWRHTDRDNVVFSALPITEDRRGSPLPLLVRAARDGRSVR